jgi:hypothetical protein
MYGASGSPGARSAVAFVRTGVFVYYPGEEGNLSATSIQDYPIRVEDNVEEISSSARQLGTEAVNEGSLDSIQPPAQWAESSGEDRGV